MLHEESLVEVELVDRLASFLEAALEHPDGDARVLRAAEGWIHAVRGHVRIGSPLVVEARPPREMAIDGRPVDPSSRAGWLHAVLARSGVAGFRVTPALEVDTLLLFGSSVKAGQAPDTDFFATWRSDVQGLQPIAPKSPEASDGFAAQLADDKAVRMALAELDGLLRREHRGDEKIDALTVLQNVVAELPRDARTDPQRACEISRQVLGVVRGELEDVLDEDPFADQGELLAAATRSVRRAVDDGLAADDHSLDHGLASGRPEPAIEDDPAELWQELASLPRGQLTLTPWDPRLPAELLGTWLHLLHTWPDWRPTPSSAPVRELLRRANQEQIRVLDTYLPENGDLDPRIGEFLQSHGLAQLLGGSQRLGPEQVVHTFPTQFLPFLDSLDAGSRSDRDAFRSVLRVIERGALRDAVQVMVDDNLLTPARTEKIFALGGRDAARFAGFLADSGANWARGKIIQFLRLQNLPPAEAVALRVVRSYRELTSAYLSDLCESIGHRGSQRLHGFTSYLLRKFVRENADRPETLDQRLHTIRTLAYIDNPETVQFLEHLSRTGRLLQHSKEARAIRQVAAGALREIRSGGPEA